MKDLSFLLFKNSVGAKMKKGIGNFCNGDGSTSTLNQHHSSCMVTPSREPSDPFLHDDHHSSERPPTLEEMILQLELEEEIAKQAKLNEYAVRGRMSCVNNSDILRSARNALNQYPRFSLDGKDSMYRSSFGKLNTYEKAGRKPACCDHGIGERFYASNYFGSNSQKTLFLPPTLAGESVVWCKPGVVAKLMGLEAMPVPISKKDSKDVSSFTKRQNLRRRAERHEMERKLAMDMSKCDGSNRRGRNRMSSCSSKANGYRVMNPVTLEPETNGGGGWPTRRFSLH